MALVFHFPFNFNFLSLSFSLARFLGSAKLDSRDMIFRRPRAEIIMGRQRGGGRCFRRPFQTPSTVSSARPLSERQKDELTCTLRPIIRVAAG